MYVHVFFTNRSTTTLIVRQEFSQEYLSFGNLFENLQQFSTEKYLNRALLWQRNVHTQI